MYRCRRPLQCYRARSQYRRRRCRRAGSSLLQRRASRKQRKRSCSGMRRRSRGNHATDIDVLRMIKRAIGCVRFREIRVRWRFSLVNLLLILARRFLHRYVRGSEKREEGTYCEESVPTVAQFGHASAEEATATVGHWCVCSFLV